MSIPNPPTDPGQLHGEIQQTRAELGDTVEALAAKTNVKARSKRAAGQLADQAKDALGDARDQVSNAASQAASTVADKASTVADKVSTAATSVKEQVSDADLAATVRRPVPLAAIGLGALLIGLVIYLIRRSRS